jgi:hypothetical protein
LTSALHRSCQAKDSSVYIGQDSLLTTTTTTTTTAFCTVLSKTLFDKLLSIIIKILDIVFYLRHEVSETGFCFRLHVETTQVGPKERAVLSPDTSKRRVLIKDRAMDNVQNCYSYIIYHRHKPIDSINLLGS